MITSWFPEGLVKLLFAVMSGEEKTTSWFQVAQLIVSIFGFAAVLATLLFGFFQYRRAERWRRGEFITKEIKEFYADPTVRNALLMIDWGRRKINIYQIPEKSDHEGERITRGIQWRALLPGELKEEYPEYLADELRDGGGARRASGTDSEAEDYDDLFTPLEAKIRDTYDVFLRYFERFSNLMELRLITPAELKPYLLYWVETIASNTYPDVNATWRCTLLTYINYYDFSGVVRLFAALGTKIEPNGELYRELMDSMKSLSQDPADASPPLSPPIDGVAFASPLLSPPSTPGSGPRIDRAVLAERLHASINSDG